jgi:ABC-type glycerol-3-phosphate transport system substrate-binding protein
MFANSKTLKKEDIVDSVVRAYTYDGKLIALQQYFTIDTLYGKTSVVGEQNSWTIQDLKALMDEYPDQYIIKSATRVDMLFTLTSFYMDAFIDWENGRCYFDGDEFKELLELVNRFPTSMEKEYFENVEPLLYINYGIYDFLEYQTILAGMREPVNFIGYPTPDGTRGIGLEVNSGIYTITSQSKQKEGAWAFMEYLLMQDNEMNTTFSVNMNILEQKITRAKNGIYLGMTDNFEPVTDENGEMPPWPKLSVPYEDEMIPIYAPTQEDVDGFYELLDSAVEIIPRSDDLLTIIRQEAAAYFGGSKTVDQVADLIQNRAQIYVSENQ